MSKIRWLALATPLSVRPQGGSTRRLQWKWQDAGLPFACMASRYSHRLSKIRVEPVFSMQPTGCSTLPDRTGHRFREVLRSLTALSLPLGCADGPCPVLWRVVAGIGRALPLITSQPNERACASVACTDCP